MRKFYVFFIILSHIFFNFQVLLAQSNSTNDSLYLLLNKSSNKNKITILYTLIQYEVNNNLSTAQVYASKLSKICENMPANAKAYANVAQAKVNISLGDFNRAKLELEKAINNCDKTLQSDLYADILCSYGLISYFTGNYYKSLEYFEKADSVYKNKEDLKSKAYNYNNISIVYQALNNYKQSIYYTSKAMEIYRNLFDSIGMALVYDNIGSINLLWKNYNNAETSFNESFLLKKRLKDNKGLAVSYNNLGIVYKSEGKLNKAIEMFNLSLERYINVGCKKELAGVYNNIGSVYFSKGNKSKALEYAEKSIAIKKEMGDVDGLVTGYINLGDVYFGENDFNNALLFYKKSLIIAENLRSNELLMKVNNSLADVYFSLENYKDGFLYLRKHLAFKDSVFSETAHYQIAELQTRYESERQDKKLKQQQIAIQRQKTVIISVSIVLFLLIIFVLIVFILNRKINKNRHLLLLSEEKFRKLFEESDDAFIIIKHAKIFEINDAALRFLCYSDKEQIINQSIDILAPEEEYGDNKSVNKIHNMLDLAYISGYNRFEWNIKTNDNKTFYTDCSFTKITIDDDYVYYLLIRDINQQKNTEIELEKHRMGLEELVKARTKELQSAKEKAEESDRLKTAFLANMSHEIRTPMNAIMGFSELLSDKDITEEDKKEFANLVNINSNNLLNLIDDIIDISKIESGQLKIKPSKVHLSSLLKEIFAIFKEETASWNTAVELKLKTGSEDDYLLTDKTRLRQILINLISNAKKFTEKGHIEYGYEIIGKEVKFYVKDTGIGIANDKKKIIFERFRQAEENHTRKYGGTGLGLAICKNIVSLLGGKIWLESILNIGSEFYFTLPILQADNIKEEKIQESLQKDIVDWSEKIILVIEDIEINYLFIRKALQKTNASFLWADNGEKALEIIRLRNDINLVLMDIRLPDIDGYKLVKMIKNINPSLKVIAQTAHAFAEEREKSILSGCDNYISKPIRRNILIQIINDSFI